MTQQTSQSKLLHEHNLVRLYLQTLLDCRALESNTAKFEADKNELRVLLSRFVANEEPTLQKLLTAPADSHSALLPFLLDRAYYWPDAGDNIWESNQGKFKRILSAPNSQARMLTDLHIQRKAGNNTEISLTQIVTAHLHSVFEMLELSASQLRLLENISKSKTGWVIANVTDKPHVVDGVAILAAHRPDAVIVRSCSTPEIFEKVIALAEHAFVIVGMPITDPIEMLLQLPCLAAQNSETQTKAITSLRGSFVHARVRRVCGSCARSTPVANQTIEQLPMQLRPRVKSTYSFGRGCEQCGHAAYRGTVGLSSVVELDKQLLALIQTGSSVAEITKAAYSQGTRCLMEDGLDRIFSGATSFEEVIKVAPGIPASFAGAIASATVGTGSHRVDGSLESLDSGTFISKDETLSLVAPKSTNSPTSKASTSKKRVLIVEDDIDQRSVLEAVFHSDGYEVFGAEHGKIALDLLASQPVDLIICDVMMPVVNGAQLVKELKSQPALKNIPVMMLTAVENPEVELSLLNLGADDYCEKNVKKRVLLKRAEKLLQRRSANPLEHMLSE